MATIKSSNSTRTSEECPTIGEIRKGQEKEVGGIREKKMKSNKIDELCPQCGKQVIFKPVGEEFKSFEFDGTIHRCRPEFELKPIGRAISGKTIRDFHLKKRRATFILSGNLVLELFASLDDELVAMNLTLVTPEGVIEEKK